MTRRLIVFNQVSLDGYFVDRNGDMSWAHKPAGDAEWDAFVAGNATGGGELLFGRVTYEMMAAFWPSAQAIARLPVVADGMNRAPKVVFSRTLDRVAWNNTRLVKAGLAVEIRRMKHEPGPSMVILGSGTLVSQLAQEGLIDEFQIVVVPVALGSGRTLFDGITTTLSFTLTNTRRFRNGNVLLYYAPTP